MFLGLLGVLGTKAFSTNVRIVISGMAITLAFWLCKEFVFDHFVEQDSWREDAKDFLFISMKRFSFDSLVKYPYIIAIIHVHWTKIDCLIPSAMPIFPDPPPVILR